LRNLDRRIQRANGHGQDKNGPFFSERGFIPLRGTGLQYVALDGHHEWQPDASAMGTGNSTNLLGSCKTPDNHLYPKVWDDWVAVGLGS